MIDFKTQLERLRIMKQEAAARQGYGEPRMEGVNPVTGMQYTKEQVELLREINRKLTPQPTN